MIECVVPCVGFGDYLRSTLPSLIPVVDDLVVVTDPDDGETVGECLRWGVRCVPSRAHRQDGRTFDRARLIQVGLERLRRESWLMVADADIWWPPTARRVLLAAATDPQAIYSADRADCVGWAHWAAIATQQHRGAEDGVVLRPPAGCHWAGRFVDPARAEWAPCGYMQLWHSRHTADYAWAPGCDADATDLLHSRGWPPEFRRLIPDLLLLHLVAGPRPVGADWAGRTTPAWGPPSLGPGPARAARGSCWAPRPSPSPAPSAHVGPAPSPPPRD